MTDSLQSLVLPPLIYLSETRRKSLLSLADAMRLGTTSTCCGPFKRKAEWGACVALALAGLAFMVFSTHSNIQAILYYMKHSA
mmetsp:Transcript_5462/g.6794  ORF Transcript_5462/g.6794 Transcript_5462/m.6794 type:complete len:83 (+) Transcript_5462:345-593(+)|eukprot:CAMPEP_0185747784 /NCGR_PEP_ID=MMETSP1174-20130828/6429_1 /TAXON_ID=35687 /ORGANISM="Dictyocha speculum, Strain CCMP1381" /LENGTH=82 /DNA_ID=CAMNT_0028423123 /DNA_START=264 /DNA_END=512 /DNA_ORIENTATION=-